MLFGFGVLSIVCLQFSWLKSKSGEITHQMRMCVRHDAYPASERHLWNDTRLQIVPDLTSYLIELLTCVQVHPGHQPFAADRNATNPLDQCRVNE